MIFWIFLNQLQTNEAVRQYLVFVFDPGPNADTLRAPDLSKWPTGPCSMARVASLGSWVSTPQLPSRFTDWAESSVVCLNKTCGIGFNLFRMTTGAYRVRLCLLILLCQRVAKVEEAIRVCEKEARSIPNAAGAWNP